MADNMISRGYGECVNTNSIPNFIEMKKEVQWEQNNVSLEQKQDSTRNNRESSKTSFEISCPNSGFRELDNGTGKLDPEISNPQSGTTQLPSGIVDLKLEASYEDRARQSTYGENDSSAMVKEDKQSFENIKKNGKTKGGRVMVAHPKTTLLATDNKENEKSVTVNVASVKTTNINMKLKLRLRI